MMATLIGLALVVLIAGAAGVFTLSDGLAGILILVIVVGFIVFFVVETARDGEAHRNARDYWRKRGSGVHDKRLDDRRGNNRG